MRRLSLTAVTALAAGLACARGESLDARDSVFVATMIELRAIKPGVAGGDSAARRAVLSRRGVSPGRLEATAAELANDPRRAAAVWRRIEQGVVVPAAPVPPDPPSPPPTVGPPKRP